MRGNHPCGRVYVLFIISILLSTCTDGKGFGGRSGGFKGGSRGGGTFGGSKGTGTFGGSSSSNRVNSMSKPRTGSSFRSNAMSFGMGALGGVAAYSLMRSMSSSYHTRPGYYAPGYGGGETCVNNEDLNGTRFGQFRCPLNGFPFEARYCCGDSGKQFCCIREEPTSRMPRGSSHFGWILLVLIIALIVIFLFVKHRRQSQKDVVMVPMEPPMDERQGPPFYQPQPPPMGYPPPPMGYQPSPMSYPPPVNGNPYAVPPQNYDGSYNPYSQHPQQQQHQMPYPPQQQPYNPYPVKEANPPAYNDAMSYNQGMSTTKPM